MAELLIDMYEPDYIKTNLSKLAKDAGINVIEPFPKLPYGDYVFCLDTFTVGIERKAVSDLLNTIKADRFRPQMAGILTSYNVPMLLIEDSLAESREGHIIANGVETGWNANAIHSMLYYVQEQHIRMALSPSERVTPQRLMNIYKYYSQPNHKDLTNDRLGVMHFKSVPGMEMLMGISGVGWDVATKLLDHFGSVRDVAGASPQELEEVVGVGPKKAQDIYAAFNNLYGASLGKAS